MRVGPRVLRKEVGKREREREEIVVTQKPKKKEREIEFWMRNECVLWVLLGERNMGFVLILKGLMNPLVLVKYKKKCYLR